MKSIVSSLFFTFLFFSVSANCDSAYSAATYALSHTKKAMKADNFDHQIYYAERALDAFDKTKGLIESCGCNESMNYVLDGIENLNEAINPADWEMGRHFSKRALSNAQEVLTALDVCSGAATASIDYNIQETTVAISNEQSHLSSEANNIKEQQRKLLKEQEKLAEQQRLLNEKLEVQKQLAEQARITRLLELEEQLKLKRIAEQSLNELNLSLKELATTLGCNNALNLTNKKYSRSENTLDSETLEDTRNYYLQQTIALQNKFSEALKKCTVN